MFICYVYTCMSTGNAYTYTYTRTSSLLLYNHTLLSLFIIIINIITIAITIVIIICYHYCVYYYHYCYYSHDHHHYYYYGFYTGLDSEFFDPCYIGNIFTSISLIEFHFYVIATLELHRIQMNSSSCFTVYHTFV